MRALLVLLALLAAVPAQAQSTSRLCNGLAQLVVAAQDGFGPLALGRYVPGSTSEARRTSASGQAEYYAVMARGSRAAARERYDALRRELQLCLPGRTPTETAPADSRVTTWTLDRALVRLVLLQGSEEVPRASVELSVVQRW